MLPGTGRQVTGDAGAWAEARAGTGAGAITGEVIMGSPRVGERLENKHERDERGGRAWLSGLRDAPLPPHRYGSTREHRFVDVPGGQGVIAWCGAERLEDTDVTQAQHSVQH